MTMTTPSSSAPVFVSGEAVRAALAWSDCVAALAVAYGGDVAGAALPARVVAATPGGSWMRVLSALPNDGSHFGLKVMGGRRAGATGPGTGQYLIVLFDKASGRIDALVDAHAITAYRTAATSALAAEHLTRRHRQGRPLRLGVLGTGLEARMHTRAIVALLDVEEVSAYSTTETRRQAFAAEMTAELGVPVRAAGTAADAARGAELVVCAARSHDERPIVSAGDLDGCRTLVSVGSTVPSQREIDVDLVERADLIVCDVVEEVAAEAGDLVAAARAGIPFAEKVRSLDALVSGAIGPALDAADLALFKSVGSGLQDITIASLALLRARESGTATPLPIELEGY